MNNFYKRSVRNFGVVCDFSLSKVCLAFCDFIDLVITYNFEISSDCLERITANFPFKNNEILIDTITFEKKMLYWQTRMNLKERCSERPLKEEPPNNIDQV